jgi:hypothetical protein
MPTQPPLGRSTPPAADPDQAAPSPARGLRWVYAPLSLLLLVPCYWQARVQAGDLSSHIYNSWLAQLIEGGRAPGLTIATQTTNVLFDLVLSALFRAAGPAAAQRIAVSLAVLIFVWGSFAFVSAVAGRRPWHLLPPVAMLAYGWVYHMGFFNFYMSLGLCFWGLAVVWKAAWKADWKAAGNWSPGRVLCAVAIFAAAWLAHALPVVWAAGLLAYLLVASRVSPRARGYAIAGSLLAMVLASVAIGQTMPAIWSWRQIYFTTGLDQVWVFDSKYGAVTAGLLVVWGMLSLDLIHLAGARPTLAGIPLQFCLLGAAGIFILPGVVQIPGFHMPLDFIAQRMSLGVGICVCAFLGAAHASRFERYAPLVLAVVFFGFLYRDERALNSFEDRIAGAVATIAPGQRVVSAFRDPDLRVVTALAHMIDRACLGRCYSYANYEPSTGQFRIRADAPNPIVAASFQQSWTLQDGTYEVRESDLPLYQVDMNGDGQIVVKSLPAGSPCGSTDWNPLVEGLPSP